MSKWVARPESSKGVANVEKTTPFPMRQGVPPEPKLLKLFFRESLLSCFRRCSSIRATGSRVSDVQEKL